MGGLDGEEGRGVLTVERGFECWIGDQEGGGGGGGWEGRLGVCDAEDGEEDKEEDGPRWRIGRRMWHIE